MAGMGRQPCPAHQHCAHPAAKVTALCLTAARAALWHKWALPYYHTETDVGKQGSYKNPIFSFLFLMWPVRAFFWSRLFSYCLFFAHISSINAGK